MTTLKLNLPDELAQRAQNAGLLTDTAIQKLLREAIAATRAKPAGGRQAAACRQYYADER